MGSGKGATNLNPLGDGERATSQDSGAGAVDDSLGNGGELDVLDDDGAAEGGGLGGGGLDEDRSVGNDGIDDGLATNGLQCESESNDQTGLANRRVD